MITFAQPLLLFGLAGIALPILAHLIHQRTTIRFSFSSIRFIRAAQIPQKGKRFPRDIPLMLLRILILSCIVLALAGMQWTPPVETTLTSKKETVILVDFSASMSGWNAFKETEEAIGNDLGLIEGDVGFVGFADKVLKSIPLADSRPSLKVMLEGLSVQQKTSNPEKAFSAALKMFSENSTERELRIYSDFQISDWQNFSSGLDFKNIGVEFIRVGQKREGNVGIYSVKTSPGYDGELRVSASVRSDLENTEEIKLTIESGPVVKKQQIEIESGEIKQVQFSIPLSNSGGRLILENEDSYATDNEFYFWPIRPPSKKVAIVELESKERSIEEEQLFLKAALTSTGLNSWNSLQLERIGLKSFDEDLNQYSSLVIPGLDGKTCDQIGPKLRDYLEQGGRVIMTFGEPVAGAFRSYKKHRLLDLGFIGIPGKAFDRSEPFRFESIEEGSKVYEVFKGNPMKDLLLTNVYQYVSVESNESVRHLIEFEEGDPFLVHGKIGEGDLYFFTTRLTTEWADLPLRSSFLPLVQELVKDQGYRSWPELEIGESYSGENEVFVSEESGTFEFEDQYIAVNVTRDESVANVLNLRQLNQMFQTGESDLAATPALNEGQNNEVSLWPWLILAAILLYVAECWYSRSVYLKNLEMAGERVHA